MDIDLLSTMVRELILEHDRVALPGLGSFVAQMVPSSFADKGFTIHPPYRRLAFRRVMEDDGLLAGLYAQANGVELGIASKIISDFIIGLKDVLESEKMVVFPGLGKLRATRENIYFFVAEEGADIWPVGAGMQPVSLKSHSDVLSKIELPAVPESATLEQEVPASEENVVETVSLENETPADTHESSGIQVLSSTQEISDTQQSSDTQESAEIQDPEEVQELEDIHTDVKLPEASREEKPVSQTIETIDNTDETVPYLRIIDQGKIHTVLSVLLVVLASAAILLAIFILLAHFCPEFIDKLLYSPAERDILYHYPNYR